VFDHSRELFFLPHAVPILDANQRVAGITIILVDSTELRQIDEAKSGLISSVSHELKTPLTSIQMAIHLLLEDGARFTPRQLEILQAARDDADRLHSLIATLLDAGRQSSEPD
jgi:two-component system, NtrC family, sensor histidine kinase KinB